MPRKRRKPNARRLRKVDDNRRGDLAPRWGWEDESWRVRQLASQLEQMAERARVIGERARVIGDRYEVRYRAPDDSSDEN